jgi:membrane protease YdiL (CAAX protease family)
MKNELFETLLGKLNIDVKIALLTIVSTTLVMVDYYYSPTSNNHWDSILLYILIPAGITILVFREKPAEYGFRLGNWRIGILLTIAGIALTAPILWILGRAHPGMQAYYQYQTEGLIWKKALEMVGWEYLFRGWLLFGYARKFGPDALWIQAVPFAIAHLGKPPLETLSTIFGGFAFGWLAWRTGSFLYPFILHWFIGTFIILVSAGTI